MPLDPILKNDIDYLKIFADKIQDVPAWKELAEAARQILGSEVDDRRRKLQKIRDSVRYRRGDVLVNVDYKPEPRKPMVDAITGVPFVPPDDTPIQFRTATVTNVIQNLSFALDRSPTVDYMQLKVTYNGRDYKWLKPFTWTQERDILLKNAYRLGFNFFNTKLNDQDLQRVVEFIQIYWNEAGSDDNFMKFIGFIKNTKFDLVALWTEGPAEPTDTPGSSENFKYPYLEPFDPDTMTSVTQGGNNWLTSHVEIQYDLAQFNQFYIINLDDLEQLFYYFSPIILVLEKITGTYIVETPVHGIGAVAATSFHGDILYPATEFITEILGISVVAATSFQGDLLRPATDFYGNIGAVSALSIVSYQGGILRQFDKSSVNANPLVNLPDNTHDLYATYAIMGFI